MGGNRDISVILNYSEDENQLEALVDTKAKIVIRILQEKYGEKILEQYISSIRENKNDYS